jgi:hypothetical protein
MVTMYKGVSRLGQKNCAGKCRDELYFLCSPRHKNSVMLALHKVAKRVQKDG